MNPEVYIHDEFSIEQMQELRSIICTTIADIQAVLQSNSDSTVELDQSRVGRLSRMDAMQHQQIAKAQLSAAKEKLIRYGNVLQMFDADPEGYGYCVFCEELIPFARLRLRPESRVCVPCLEKK